jgi:hypothetical protein
MNRRSSSLRILLVAFAMLSFIAINAGIAHGQAISGNLTGTVTDASAAALNGATVEAVNLDTNQKVTSTTRGSGEYLFTNLPVGNYKITVSATGFKTTTLASVPVDLNRTGTANVQLQVGTSATTVEVSGVAPPVDTTSAQLQSTYLKWTGRRCSKPLALEPGRDQCERHGPRSWPFSRRPASSR